MLDDLQRHAVAALAASLLIFSLATAEAGSERSVLRCRGALQYGDALARAAIVYVDLDRGQVSTPACRKYPDFDRYCTGLLLDLAPHWFQFGGAVSPENTKFWADLYRTSAILPPTAAGPATEAMRVLFLGTCERTSTSVSVRLK
jgi:hypothetical protein